MSIRSAHAAAFFTEIRDGSVWTIEDDGGIPAPLNPDGTRAMPFWSKESRALKVIATVDAYRDFRTKLILVDEWEQRWLPGIEGDGFLVGLNWSGQWASGFDLSPHHVLARIAATRELCCMFK